MRLACFDSSNVIAVGISVKRSAACVCVRVSQIPRSYRQAAANIPPHAITHVRTYAKYKIQIDIFIFSEHFQFLEKIFSLMPQSNELFARQKKRANCTSGMRRNSFILFVLNVSYSLFTSKSLFVHSCSSHGVSVVIVIIVAHSANRPFNSFIFRIL